MRKVKVETDNSNWKAPKKRKPRKPMTEKQRQAAAERLEKARKVRAAKNPDYGKSNIHPSLRDLPKEHYLHPDKVKSWIKSNKDLIKEERRGVRQNIKGSNAKLASLEGYVRHMQKYLRDGDWIDNFFGEHQQSKIKWRCVAMAYYPDGTPKRSVGTWYEDIGVYTQEMYNADRGMENGKQRTRRKRNSRAVGEK